MGQLKSSNILDTFVYPLIISVVFLFIYAFIFDMKLDTNGDNYNYLNYATSILDGHGYSSPYNSNYSPTNWYPPGYSSLLAITMVFFGENIPLLKVLNGVLYLVGLILFYIIIKKSTNDSILAFSITLLLTFNPGLLRFSTILMSEIPFLFFTMFTVYLVIHFDENNLQWRSPYFLGIIISAITTYYFRTAGISLLVSICIHWAIQKKWKQIGLYITGLFILYLPWIIRNSIHGIKGRYMGSIMAVNPWRPEEGNIGSISEFVSKMKTNLFDTVLKGFPETLFNFYPFKDLSTESMIVIGGLTLLIILFGIWKLQKINYLLLFLILGNIGIFMIWHGGNGIRYVWTITPFLALGFFNGLIQPLKLLFTFKNQKVYSYFSLLILLLFIPYKPQLQAYHQNAQKKGSPAYQNYFKIAKEIKHMEGQDVTVTSRKPGMFHFYSDVFVNNYKYTLDIEEQIDFLKKSGTDYVVLEQLGYSSTNRYLYPAVQRYPNKFKIIKHIKNPDTYLLKFSPDLGYTGEWENNERSGYGTFVWENGMTFAGNWKNNVRNGKGTLYFSDGRQLEGSWENDKLHGPAIIKSKEGTIIERCEYQHNKKIKIY
ncbi:phospholipid carrier-dependent glycosyltransferase [bacterium SCSIO 12643]|nr:phospholipid carrier-dependent glycosyltransferase [bacterium SCSIO 12643]